MAGDVVYAGDAQGTLYAIENAAHEQLCSYEAQLRPGDPGLSGRCPMILRREFAGGPLVVAHQVVMVSDVGGTVYARG